MPIQIPTVVTGTVFLQFYYYLLSILGINLMQSIGGIFVAHLFVAIPYSVGSISAVLVRMDTSIEDASLSLGASNWNTFWQVTFPALKPGIGAGLFYAFIISFGDVPIALFLSTPGTLTLPVLIFQDMQFDFHVSMLAMSTIVTLSSLVFIMGIQKIGGLDLVSASAAK